MEVEVVNMEGKKVSKVELPAAIFEAPINIDLMHQAFVRQMANAHLGTQTMAPKRNWASPTGFIPVCAMERWWKDPYAAYAVLCSNHASKNAPGSFTFRTFCESR
jgi:hypothetical protein